MPNHPLQFFKDIDDVYLFNNLKEEFYTTGLARDADLIDRDKEVIGGFVLFVGDENVTTFYISFAEHLQGKLINATRQALNLIDNDIMGMAREGREAAIYFKSIYNLLNHLMAKFKSLEHHLCKYPVAYQELFNLKTELVNRYRIQDDSLIPITVPESQNIEKNSIIKLKWLGNTNILTTLFYDLIMGDKKQNISPLIEASPKEIARFLYENFCEKDGSTFLLNTLETNLKPSKQSAKRAKGAISIELKYHKD